MERFTPLRITIDDLVDCIVFNTCRGRGQETCKYISNVLVYIDDPEQKDFYEGVIDGITFVLKEVLARDTDNLIQNQEDLKRYILNEAYITSIVQTVIPISASKIYKYGVPLDSFPLPPNDSSFKMNLLVYLMDVSIPRKRKNIGNVYTKQEIMLKAADELNNFKIDIQALEHNNENYADNSHKLCRPVLKVIKS